MDEQRRYRGRGPKGYRRSDARIREDVCDRLTEAPDVDVAARYFEFYGGAIDVFYGETLPLSDEILAYTLREPFGVTAHIVPWNYPIQISARTIAPALATGNCCVLKPAEEATLTAVRLGALCLEAGLPAGVFNLVSGTGPVVGEALAAAVRAPFEGAHVVNLDGVRASVSEVIGHLRDAVGPDVAARGE